MKTMSDSIAVKLSASVSSVIALVCLTWWLSYNPTARLATHIPGMDNRPTESEASKLRAAEADQVRIGEFLETYASTQPPALRGEWPRFRGSKFNNISTEPVRLASTWSEQGPKQLWSVALGEGHAAPAVADGRVYVLDYDEQNKGDALRCFSLADGSELWRRWYRVRVKRNHGYSRTIPAVADGYVVTIGPRCHVMCVDVESAELKWGIDLEKELGTETPLWYTGQCPLIDDSIAVIASGGNALLLGVELATGTIAWQTPNPKGYQMSHSSVMPATLFGKRMYIYCAKGGIVGVSAEEVDRGELLWESPLWNPSVMAPSPVILPDGRIFVTGGYGAGSALLKVTEVNGGYAVEELLKYKPDGGMASEQQTPIFYQNHFFAILPKDAGVLRKQLVCYAADDIINPVWTSGTTNRFGLGPYLIADGKMFVLDDDGVLTMLEVSTTAYKPLAQAKVMDGTDAWGPMALVGGRLLLRDAHTMICLDISAPSS